MKLFDDFWATLPITLWNHNKKLSKQQKRIVSKMPGALEIDFTKVRRKIRSVPGSPKSGSSKSSRFSRKSKQQKVFAISTPCTPVTGSSKLDLRQFLSGDRRGISISVSDDESEKSFKKLFGNNKKLRGARSSEEFLTSTARKICGDELLNLGRGPGGASAKVCVVLNDDELLLVSFLLLLIPPSSTKSFFLTFLTKLLVSQASYSFPKKCGKYLKVKRWREFLKRQKSVIVKIREFLFTFKAHSAEFLRFFFYEIF